MVLDVQVPNGAAGFYLLGKICRLTNRHKVAQSYHKAALTLDPLLWSAYEELCMLGMFSKWALLPEPCTDPSLTACVSRSYALTQCSCWAAYAFKTPHMVCHFKHTASLAMTHVVGAGLVVMTCLYCHFYQYQPVASANGQ